MEYRVKRKEEILEEIVYNHYGESFGYLEEVLKENIFLCKRGIYLEEGSIIKLPKITIKEKMREKLV